MKLWSQCSFFCRLFQIGWFIANTVSESATDTQRQFRMMIKCMNMLPGPEIPNKHPFYYCLFSWSDWIYAFVLRSWKFQLLFCIVWLSQFRSGGNQSRSKICIRRQLSGQQASCPWCPSNSFILGCRRTLYDKQVSYTLQQDSYILSEISLELDCSPKY